MIIVFGMKDCKFCKVQKKEIDNLPKKICHYIDVDEDDSMLDLAEDAGIENLPTIVFFNKSGQEFFRAEGTMSAKSILKKLNEGM